MSAKKIVEQIMALDDQIMKLEDEFETLPAADRVAALADVMRGELGRLGIDDPLTPHLMRGANLLASIEGTGPVELIAEGLGHVNPDARLLCGEVLAHLADDGFDRIMPAVEKALREGGTMAEEMPFILAELEDAKVVPVIGRFLGASDVGAVASAIEALADRGDAAAVPMLKKLVNDKRAVERAEDDQKWTVGELAREALEIIESNEEE